MTSDRGEARPWHWPGRWTRDERFWRDITVGTASGMLIVFFTYMGALWLGYVKSPNGLRSAFEATWLIVFLLTTVTVVDRYSALKVSKRLARRMNKWFAKLVSFGILTGTNMLIVMIEYFALWLAFRTFGDLLGLDTSTLTAIALPLPTA